MPKYSFVFLIAYYKIDDDKTNNGIPFPLPS